MNALDLFKRQAVTLSMTGCEITIAANSRNEAECVYTYLEGLVGPDFMGEFRETGDKYIRFGEMMNDPDAKMHDLLLAALDCGIMMTVGLQHAPGAYVDVPIDLDEGLAERNADAALGATVRKYFTSGNEIEVERATILRKDIAEYL